MKQTYRVIAGVIALGVLVQAAAVAFGWFDAISELDKGLVIDENYEGNAGHMLHGIVGHVRDAAARPDPADRVLLRREGRAAAPASGRGIVFGVIVLQVVLAFVAFSAPIVGALHGINALVILGAAARAGALTRDTRAAAPGGDRAPSRASGPARARRVVAPVDLPCLSGSAAAGGWSFRSSCSSWAWASPAGTGRRAWCPRRTPSWRWATPSSAAGPRTRTGTAGRSVADLTGPADGEPDVAVELAARQESLRARRRRARSTATRSTAPRPGPRSRPARATWCRSR